MTRSAGQTASRRYRVTITAWFSTYVHTLIPVENPADPARGVDATCHTRISHVSASPRYKRHRAAIAARNELNRNVRSKSMTMIGAVTIDSFTPMPGAHANTETIVHRPSS